MERNIVERRTVLKGGAAAVGLLSGGASSEITLGVDQAFADTPQSEIPHQIQNAIQRFRETIPPNFDNDYVENAVIPFFLTSVYEGERPKLPMIGVNFSKENALPRVSQTQSAQPGRSAGRAERSGRRRSRLQPVGLTRVVKSLTPWRRGTSCKESIELTAPFQGRSPCAGSI
jgi:hypothetical protein